MAVARSLVGAWRLVSCEYRLEKGGVWHPFGLKPSGRLVYTRGGRMIAMVMDSRRPLCASGGLFDPTDAELASSARGFVAYSGRWEMKGGQVVHRVDISLFPNWVGTRQARFVAFDGKGRLELSTRPFLLKGKRQTARLLWEREKP